MLLAVTAQEKPVRKDRFIARIRRLNLRDSDKIGARAKGETFEKAFNNFAFDVCTLCSAGTNFDERTRRGEGGSRIPARQ
jgi:hypothetical protein